MKRQTEAFWKQLRSQPAAIVAVVIMLAAALATVMHAYCMRKAVDKTVQEAFFAVSVANPSDAIVERKVAPYAYAGITQFFSSGIGSVVQAIVDQRILFFQPTEADILCDFTTTNSTCSPSIDLITCSESVMPFPANRKVDNMAQLSNTLVEPASSDDCTVFVHDGLYKFSKVALWVPASAWVQPGQPADGPCYLVMPRKDIVTKLIMLLRPSFIRSNGSKLYSVAYNNQDDGRPDADWRSYTSWDERPNATLRLLPVTDNRIEAPSGQQPLPDLIPAPRDTQRRLPATLDAVVPRADLSSQPLVLYFLKYGEPNLTGKGLPSGAATLYQSVDATFDAQAKESGGKTLLRVSREASSSDIKLAVPGVNTSMTIPAIDQGVVVATRTGDTVVAAVFGPSRVAVRRWSVGSWLVYSSISDLAQAKAQYLDMNPDVKRAGMDALVHYNAYGKNEGRKWPGTEGSGSLPGSGASPSLREKIGVNTATCIPCLADIALRTTGLLETDVTTVDIEDQLNSEFGDTFDGSIPLRPGKYLVSANKRYTAKFQADCNLVVWDTTTNFPIWDSKTRMPSSTPGRLDLDTESGVLKMSTAGGATYWQSSALRGAGRKDLGMYRLVLENDGILRLRSGYGNIIAWESTPGSYGTMYLTTCGDAAASYQGQHSGEQTYRVASSAWDHYQRFGKTAGYAWPGPVGPC